MKSIAPITVVTKRHLFKLEFGIVKARHRFTQSLPGSLDILDQLMLSRVPPVVVVMLVVVLMSCSQL